MMASGFTLYFPFQLSPGRDIKDLPHTSSLAGKAAEIKANKPHTAVVVSGIPSEEEALTLLSQLSDALRWMSLQIGVGVSFSGTLGDVYRPDDPVEAAKNLEAAIGLKHERVDLTVDGGKPYVKRDSEQHVIMTGQPVTFRVSHGPEQIVGSLDDGLGVARAAAKDLTKLRLASEVYSQTHFLPAGFARFQALFIPLEVVAPQKELVNAAALEQVREWQEQLRTRISSSALKDADRRELNALSSRVGQLSQQSHGSRICDFVERTLADDGVKDAKEQADTVRRLYRKRGALTHEGSRETSEDLQELEGIVRRSLMGAWRLSRSERR